MFNRTTFTPLGRLPELCTESVLNSRSEKEEILLAFFEATGGASWRNRTGWGVDANISYWHGVGVNLWPDDDVLTLHLSYNGLNGGCTQASLPLFRVFRLARCFLYTHLCVRSS